MQCGLASALVFSACSRRWMSWGELTREIPGSAPFAKAASTSLSPECVRAQSCYKKTSIQNVGKKVPKYLHNSTSAVTFMGIFENIKPGRNLTISSFKSLQRTRTLPTKIWITDAPAWAAAEAWAKLHNRSPTVLVVEAIILLRQPQLGFTDILSYYLHPTTQNTPK